MKKSILFITAAIICLMCACDGQNDNPSNESQADITLKNFANTGCKREFQARTRTDEDAWTETLEYSCIHTNYLYVKHNNVVFNCCPGELKADIKVSDNAITVTEWSTDDLCKCICTYDLSYEIGPLKEGHTYSLSIGHKGSEHPVADFTFSNSMSGLWPCK